jgi:hypothetical protein
MLMDDVAAIPPARAERPPPEVLAGLGALARVSRALVGTGSLAELGKRALAEMRTALGLELAVLYLPVPGEPGLARFVSSAAAGAQVAAREEVRYEPEAWRLAVTSGMPIVLREPAAWLGPNPSCRPRTTGSCSRSWPAATTWSAWSSRRPVRRSRSTR